MTGDEEELTFRARRGSVPRPDQDQEPREEPTQVDDATRLAARGLDSTRLGSRGPARELRDRISAPTFSGELPALRPDPTRGPGDTYGPRTDAPATGEIAAGAAALAEARAAAGAPDPAAPRIVDPAERRERDIADRRRRTLRGAAIAAAAVASLAAAVAVAIALL